MPASQFEVDRIVRKAKSLPSPPLVLSRLMGLMSRGKRTRADVVRVIEVDSAFTAEVLRVVNSAKYRRARQINTVSDAIGLLGEAELIRIVVRRASSVMAMPEVPGYGLEDNGLWRNSLRVALAADAVAWKSSAVPSAVAYTAGLICDVGKLAMGAFLADSVDDVIEWQEAHPGSQWVEAERAILGLDHAELGALMVAEWGLPKEIVQAVRYHHRPASAGGASTLAYHVHVADALATMVGDINAVDVMWYSLDPYWSHQVDLGNTELDELVDEVRQMSEAVEQQLKN